MNGLPSNKLYASMPSNYIIIISSTATSYGIEIALLMSFRCLNRGHFLKNGSAVMLCYVPNSQNEMHSSNLFLHMTCFGAVLLIIVSPEKMPSWYCVVSFDQQNTIKSKKFILSQIECSWDRIWGRYPLDNLM